MRTSTLLVLALVASCACGGAQSMKSSATKAQWDDARAIAVAYVDATFHLPADKVRAENPRLPFLFAAALPGISSVLVHQGKVVDGGGLKALGAYLDAVDAYADHALTADDVLDLLYEFKGFPPVDPATGGPNAYVTDEGTALSMTIAWRGGDADFTLAYRLQPAEDPDIDESEPEESSEVTVSLWTLHLARGTEPRWSEVRKTIDAE